MYPVYPIVYWRTTTGNTSDSIDVLDKIWVFISILYVNCCYKGNIGIYQYPIKNIVYCVLESVHYVRIYNTYVHK